MAPHCETREIETLWIPMSDGVRLAARVWMPIADNPCPALLEYIPYRRRDLVRARDEQNHPYFAAKGFVCLRVDMRGSGDSEGVMPDMYSEHELSDAKQVIEWIAAQPWCNGRVGMFGTSWGGTASLQAAVNAPSALRAVIANCATADRFEDDIHWMGGCLLTDSIEWGATLPAILAAPPDAATVGESWFEQWQQRLDQLTFPLQHWIANNVRGTYWRHGSVLYHTRDLSCPILAIGGWSDRYSNTVMRLVERRPDICRGIVGPWGHHYPDQASPGPGIGFQAVALQWFNHWLKETDIEVTNWPLLRLWKRNFDKPTDTLETRSGSWIEVNDVNKKNTQRWYVDGTSLITHKPKTAQLDELCYQAGHGVMSGDTGYFGRSGGLPLEQSREDKRSLIFDTAPLQQALDIIGSAVFEVDVRIASSSAQLICRVCDVSPAGDSNLIVRGVLNLTLDKTLDARRNINGDSFLHAIVTLPNTAYSLAPGHRLRLALANSYWPLIWPPSETGRFTLALHSARLTLPLQHSTSSSMREPLPDPEKLPLEPSWQRITNPPLERQKSEKSGEHLFTGWQQRPLCIRYHSINIEMTTATRAQYQISQSRGDARCCVHYSLKIKRPDGEASVDSIAEVNSSDGNWVVQCQLLASWNGREIASKESRIELPMDSTTMTSPNALD